MSDEAAKHAVKNALGDFAKKSFCDASISLLESLGYRSEKRLDLKPNTPKTFLAQFADGRKLNPDHALLGDWQTVDFLFQLTEDEIKSTGQGNFVFEGKGKYNNTVIESYLFFAIALKNSEYTRTQLSGITREINKLFRMPAMLLFRHGPTLTLSIINRRLHKRDESKDVLEKVTLIKDIRIADPHRAHIEILFDLSLTELHEQHHFTNWSELQAAWQRTLDSSELNKRFFQEIANWYFWASDHVKFPKPKDIKDADAYKAQSLIRLITRLIFCWFVKEKGLLPNDLFNPVKLQALLKEGDKLATAKHTVYYKAILQNLFFATLNREMNTPDEPDNRKFRGRTKQKNGRDQHHMIHNVYRYEDAFQDSKIAVQVFSDIPFLNGGLFECLDRTVGPKEKPEYVRIDGFSDRDDNPLAVPDFLFFGEVREVDLSAAYGETRFKRAKVRGLIHTFYHYKFTITENTPIEEEIALDPELAGKVFENLLAAYNPETATTARKQTGSFFTPREIVNYMVDETLIAYLQTKLQSALPNLQSAFEPRLRHLLSYNDEPHQFTSAEVKVLIEAIDKLKVLDPACGSGAYPMGMLHKLVFILGKLDPRNEQWEKRQISRVKDTIKTAEKTEDAATRERMLKDLDQQIANIEEAFQRNELDYGRKLYLIENCIYGVDIQPIAVQIAKMRFFISLVVDQRIDRKADNLGIRPLPNLETKFVAANTLIGIEKPTQQMLRNPQIDAKEMNLKEVRNNHFSARTPSTKAKWRELDTKLRAEISALLKADGFRREITEKLANWNPYDQNASADFFDPEWMFGMLEGFDVVIGNPPYVRVDELRAEDKEKYRSTYKSATGKYDLYYLFLEHALNSICSHGVLSFITPNKYCAATSATKLRSIIFSRTSKGAIVSTSKLGVFKEAANYPVISHLQVGESEKSLTIREAVSIDQIQESSPKSYRLKIPEFKLLPDGIIPINVDQSQIDFTIKLLRNHPRLGSVFSISEGLRIPSSYEKEEQSDYLIVKQYQFERWTKIRKGTHISERDLKKVVSPTSERFMKIIKPKIVLAEDGLQVTATIDDKNCVPQGGVYFGVVTKDHVSLQYVLGLLNSKLVSCLYEILFGGMHMGGGYLRYRTNFLEALPFPNVDQTEQTTILTIVEKILAVKQRGGGAGTSELEQEIDRHVYALYGLTPEEIKIVEASSH